MWKAGVKEREGKIVLGCHICVYLILVLQSCRNIFAFAEIYHFLEGNFDIRFAASPCCV